MPLANRTKASQRWAGRAEPDGNRWVFGLLRNPVGQWILRLIPTRAVLKDNLLSAYYRPELLTEERLTAWHRPMTTKNGLLAYMRRRTQQVTAEREGRVATIRAPTLILQGDQDQNVPMATAKRYHELIPKSELVMLAETGHMIQEERPETVIQQVSRWTDAHSQGSGS